MRHSWSFRAIRASFVAVLVLGAVALGTSVWLYRFDEIDHAARNARNMATVLGGQIERSIQSVDIILRGIQGQIEQWDLQSPNGDLRIADPQAVRRTFLNKLDLLFQGFQIGVADAHGRLIVLTTALPTPDIDVSDRDYFKELQANDDDRLSISLPLANRVDGTPTVVMARRLNGVDRRFSGIVLIGVKQSYFESIYGAVSGLRGQTFILTRPDGTILFRHPDTQHRAGQKIPSNWRYHDVVAEGGGVYRSPGLFDLAARWIAVAVLERYPLVVGIGVPEDAILAKWRVRTATILGGAAAFLLCALGLLRLMARQYHELSASETSLSDKSRALEYEHAQLVAREAELKLNQTRLEQSETQLRAQNERFDAALNHMSQGLAMFDRDARLVVCNEQYRQSHRMSVEQARPGRSIRDIIVHCQERCGFPQDVETYLADIAGMVAAGRPRAHEVEDRDGRIYSVTDDPMPSGGWVVTFEDVTARRANENKVHYLARNDLLTGLGNRQTFLEAIDTARQQLQASGAPFNVFMLDLDRFKRVNDALGHAAGDLLLREAARRLQASIRDADVVARLGGDEFAVIQTAPRSLDRCEDAVQVMMESAITLANRIIELIAEPFQVGGECVLIGTSIGIAMAPEDGADAEELVKKADLALYRTKAQGRNAYSFFEREMAVESERRQQLGAELRTALERNEFELYYQPLIDVATRRPSGMEALVRWNHPDQGLMTPDRFLSLAEDTGLLSSIGEWILQTACATAAAWPEDVKLAINLSPVQFHKTNLFDMIICALVDTGLPPERFEVEITERVLSEKDADYISTLHQLRNLGVTVVLDNFGSGQSSLGLIKMFPFDKIKLDRSLVQEVLDKSESAALVGAVANLGRSLDIVTAAEGVETEAQFAVLRAAGVSQVQGFLFGRPHPAGKITFGAAEPAHEAAHEAAHGAAGRRQP